MALRICEVLLLLLLLNIISADSATVIDEADFELISKEKIQAGKSKLEEFTANAKSSDCWKKAVAGIGKRCKTLGDVEQSYLAIDFTNCHLSKSRRKIYSCSRETQSIEECTGSMDDTTYLTYTTFFAHTTNICFYVKSELWQARTEDTISELSRTSQQVADQLEESAQRQILVLQKQNISLANQKEIISNEIQLSATLKNSTVTAKKAFEEMKQNAFEQKALFTETFDSVFKAVEKVQKLQSLILGEFISLQSVSFYIAAVCTCYFLTSTPRTAAGRLPLFIGLFILIFIERLVTSWGVTETQSTNTEVIHSRLWFFRKLYLIIATVVIMVVGYQYQDYNKINFDMLREMQLQIQEMKGWQEKIKSLKALTNGESSPQPSQNRQWIGSIIHPGSRHVQICDAQDGPISDCAQNLYDDDDDDDDESDCSYTPDESDLESFSDESSEEEDHNDSEIEEAKPVKRTQVTGGKPRGTPKATDSASSRRTRSNERVHDSSPSVRYNLRSRGNTPSHTRNGRFLSNMPSPSKLKELINKVQQGSSRRYTAVVCKQNNKNTDKAPLFSSDEES
ncbi:uncharacterized protein LOC111339004 [Stylophora pistillata]|uniref:Protein brambleberry n=1 Tax=Stylophora pistillata TaxID=50429 RepID=A0A2B4RPT1_STYPI|nr:uncharacterized protein LOC111339004 [Stylophora pistillata]PFX18809.1 Protein brambleberry [Stylophora pistillata]